MVTAVRFSSEKSLALPRWNTSLAARVTGASLPTAVVWRFGNEADKGFPIPIHGRFTANNSEAVALMARKGLGLALLADWLVADDIRRGRLVPLLEGFDAPPAPVYALSPPGRFSAVAVRALGDHLADAIGTGLIKAW